MNKTLLKLGLVIALSMAAASAFGAAEVVATVIGGGSFSSSNNVKIFASATDNAYIAVSGHLQGDKAYGSSNGSPSINYKAKTAGTALTASDVPSDFSSGWNTL
jgi:hypothetical protein